MIEKCCAFTGHRPQKLPWGYDETDARCIVLKETLAKKIAGLAGEGYTDFFPAWRRGSTSGRRRRC